MKKPQPPSEKVLKSAKSLVDLMMIEPDGEEESTFPPPDGIEQELRNDIWECVLVPKEENIEQEKVTAEMKPFQMHEGEVVMLTDLLRGMLKYKPSDRISAAEALEHPWFKTDFGSGNSDTIVPTEQSKESLSGALSLTNDDTTKLKLNSQDDRVTKGKLPRKLFQRSPSQIFWVLSICLPIVVSLILLWSMGLRSERVRIGKLEIFNIVVEPSQRGPNGDQGLY